jgi:hypothetical protein
MADFFNQPLNHVLPKVLPLSIEDLEEPKKPIDPTLAARLVQKPVSPPKSPRSDQKKYTLHITNGKRLFDDEEPDSFGSRSLDEVLPKKNTQAVELLDPPRRPITSALATRLCGTAA